jgi:hypothetical protein
MATQSLTIGRASAAPRSTATQRLSTSRNDRAASGTWKSTRGRLPPASSSTLRALRSDEIAALAGNFLPLVAIQLQHLVTEAIPEVADLETELPVLRGLDGSFYLRQELDGILTGVYEEKPVFWAIDGIPPPRLWSGHLARKPGARRKKRRRCPSPRARPRLGGDQEYQPSVAPLDAPPTPKA